MDRAPTALVQLINSFLITVSFLLFQLRHLVARWPIGQTDFGYFATFSHLANVCQEIPFFPTYCNN